MALQENPLQGVARENIHLSSQAQYLLERRLSREDIIEKLVHAPSQDVSRDARTGHYVTQIGKYYVVWRSDPARAATIITVMSRDQFPA
jgi:hypothetical protein